MKKNNILSISMVLLMVVSFGVFSGCEKDFSTLTYQDLVEANTIENILAGHTSVSYSLEDANHPQRAYETYFDADNFAVIGDNYQAVYTPEVQGVMSNGSFHSILNMSDVSAFEGKMESSLFYEASKEKITDIVEQEDSTLLVTTVMSAEDSAPFLSLFGSEAEDGDFYSCEYVVDRSTYILKSFREYLCHESGEREVLDAVEEILYDTTAPKYIDEVLASASETKTQTQNPDDLRTVSVTMDPDTAQEKTVSISVPKGTGVAFNYREGYNTLYLDRACTQVYQDGSADKNEDLILYSIADED